MAAMQGVDVILDQEHAREVAHVKCGVFLLGLGFVGQFIDGLQSHWPTWVAGLIWPLVVGLLGAAWLIREPLAYNEERAIFRERLEQSSTGQRATVVQIYREAHKRQGRVTDIDRWMDAHD